MKKPFILILIIVVVALSFFIGGGYSNYLSEKHYSSIILESNTHNSLELYKRLKKLESHIENKEIEPALELLKKLKNAEKIGMGICLQVNDCPPELKKKVKKILNMNSNKKLNSDSGTDAPPPVN